MNAPPPSGDEAKVWRQHLRQDANALVALADNMLRNCGQALRVGIPVDPLPLAEMAGGLAAMPAEAAPEDAVLRAQLLLDGGALALGGMATAAALVPERLPSLVHQAVDALDRGDEEEARRLASPLLGAIIQMPDLPVLPDIPTDCLLDAWADAAGRIRQARFGG